MNLFRSEEHVKNWNGFRAGTEEGILPVPDLVKLFSGPLFTRRLDPDYVSSGMYLEQFRQAVVELGKARQFWSPA
jgi:hypothetical protein